MNTSKTQHLKPFRMNTYEKRGEGVTLLLYFLYLLYLLYFLYLVSCPYYPSLGLHP